MASEGEVNFNQPIFQNLNLREQITSTVLMVRPANFGYNEETAINNAFQTKDSQKTPVEIQQAAIREFDALVSLLSENGIQVIGVDDSPTTQKPDAVFPNNWVSFHQDGNIITYPMFSPVRRLERNEDILRKLTDSFGFNQRYHLERYEQEELFLEGTGSMVLDRVHKLAYACVSPRTNLVVLKDFCKFAGYEPVSFQAVDDSGSAIYHTNVMMAIAQDFAIVCMEAIANANGDDVIKVEERLTQSGKTIIPISLEQMKAFAGNMLQLKNQQGQNFLVMSEQAYQSLTESQISQINSFTQILYSPIYTIEKFGGGSVRCMIAEVFSPSIN